MTQEAEDPGFWHPIQILEQLKLLSYLEESNNSYKARMKRKPLWKQKCFFKKPKGQEHP